MDYLPLYTDLRGRRCLVVGGGAVALRKARLLSRAGAVLRLVAPSVLPELRALVRDGGGEVLETTYLPAHLEHCVLVVVATDDRELNRSISEAAQARQLPVNVVDDAELCSVILPAIVDRSPVLIAIGSGGRSPVLVRMLKTRLETFIPAGVGRLAEFAGQFRDRVKSQVSDAGARLRFWEQALDGPIAEQVYAARPDEAERLLDAALAAPAAVGRGEVYLIGAGPGDPDLMTFKALRLLQKADVVLHDRLVSDAILTMARADAEMIYVGKRKSEHAVPQQDMNRLLVKLALEGKRVARLKGGDPFIFGRGGEEIEELSAAGIPFQVVPGITAASGCASYAGIPLTHRDYAQSVRFVTGHLKDGSIDLPWPELVHPTQTVVFYMGLTGLTYICEQLIAHGRAAATPAALIERGTLPEQKVSVGTLQDLPAIVARENVKPPTLIIVGEVVSLRERLNWH